MAETTFRHGNPVMVDYTPSSGAITAGQVVLAGNTTGLTCLIAHVDIANSTLGSMAAGDGVYDVVNLNNAANYTKVYWDDTNNKITTVSTNNAQFGYIVDRGALGANTTARAIHVPRA